MPDFIDRDISTALLTTRSKNSDLKRIMVTSVYMDKESHKDSPWPSALPKLLRFCLRKNLPLFVLADTNSHSTLWGESQTDARGSAIED